MNIILIMENQFGNQDQYPDDTKGNAQDKKKNKEWFCQLPTHQDHLGNSCKEEGKDCQDEKKFKEWIWLPAMIRPDRLILEGCTPRYAPYTAANINQHEPFIVGMMIVHADDCECSDDNAFVFLFICS